MSLIIFASGAGTNAKAIMDYFRANAAVRVSLIVCNKPGAGVLKIAEAEGIATLLINRADMETDAFIETLQSYHPKLIVLAGFLLKIPRVLTQLFPSKIINLHPALLPLYGGKGMYGAHVHEAVLKAGDKASGITIHYVNEGYDEGNIILQAHCPVLDNDTVASLAARIHGLEHFYLPRVVAFLVSSRC